MRTLIGSFLFCCGLAAAQHHHSAGAAGEKPVALYPGLGIWKHAVATSNPEAQKFFDQGLVLTYSFNRPEAVRSFQKALELDPKLAMADWGLAMAWGPYINMDGDPDVDIKKSCAAAEAGLKIASNDTDRAWLMAVSTRCPDFSDPSKYIAAMKDLAAKFPDDPDAQTMYAESLMVPSRWRWYDAKGNPAPGMEECEHVLERVLRRFPNHPGANHYYIHAVESSPLPERGVPSAQRLMGVVPWAGHMVHMPGHIWLVLGEYNYAVDVNERAAQVDREFFEKTGLMGTYYSLYLHNLDFVVYARSMQGRVAETDRAVAKLMEASDAAMKSNGPAAGMAGAMMSVAVMTQVRNQEWDALLKSPKPDVAEGEWIWRYARIMSLHAKGRAAEARAESVEFDKVSAKIDRKQFWGVNSFGDMLDLASTIVEARLDGSVEKWRKAVAMQDALAYDEPPAWYYPVRESLGAALLRSGDASAAEEVFRDGVRRSPHNGRMLFGLMESLKKQGKPSTWVQQEFEAAWKGADLKLRIEDL